MFVYINMYIYLYICIYMYIHICIYIYIYIYIYTMHTYLSFMFFDIYTHQHTSHTHTYTHTHTHTHSNFDKCIYRRKQAPFFIHSRPHSKVRRRQRFFGVIYETKVAAGAALCWIDARQVSVCVLARIRGLTLDDSLDFGRPAIFNLLFPHAYFLLRPF